MSHVVKFDGSVALVYALHNLPFDFSLLQLKKSCITVQRVVEGGCGFTKIGRCLKVFVRTVHTIMLSAPLTASIFLRLCLRYLYLWYMCIETTCHEFYNLPLYTWFVWISLSDVSPVTLTAQAQVVS